MRRNLLTLLQDFSQLLDFTGPCNKESGEVTQIVCETDVFELCVQLLNFLPIYCFYLCY